MPNQRLDSSCSLACVATGLDAIAIYPLRPRTPRTLIQRVANLSGFFLPLLPSLLFEYSGELPLRSVPSGHAPSPSKAHVQTEKSGVTSGAQDFENVEQFGHRYLNRADSENHPAKDSETEHNSATRQACRSIRHCRRQVERRCCDCARTNNRREGCKVLFRFRFLTVRQALQN